MKKLLASFVAAASLATTIYASEPKMCTNEAGLQGNAEEQARPRERKGFNWLDDRSVWLIGILGWSDGQNIINELSALDKKDPGKDIELRLMSVGGNVTAGLAIIDFARTLESDVRTVCLGQASSMAAMILIVAGTHGKRFATEECRIMIHQPSWEVTGDASMMEIRAKEMVKAKERFVDMLTESTRLSREKVERMVDRDTYLSAQEAKDLGFIDEIIPRYESRKTSRIAVADTPGHQPKP